VRDRRRDNLRNRCDAPQQLISQNSSFSVPRQMIDQSHNAKSKMLGALFKFFFIHAENRKS
jgi:hypothetical protein